MNSLTSLLFCADLFLFYSPIYHSNYASLNAWTLNLESLFWEFPVDSNLYCWPVLRFAKNSDSCSQILHSCLGISASEYIPSIQMGEPWAQLFCPSCVGVKIVVLNSPEFLHHLAFWFFFFFKFTAFIPSVWEVFNKLSEGGSREIQDLVMFISFPGFAMFRSIAVLATKIFLGTIKFPWSWCVNSPFPMETLARHSSFQSKDNFPLRTVPGLQGDQEDG